MVEWQWTSSQCTCFPGELGPATFNNQGEVPTCAKIYHACAMFSQLKSQIMASRNVPSQQGLGGSFDKQNVYALLVSYFVVISCVNVAVGIILDRGAGAADVGVVARLPEHLRGVCAATVGDAHEHAHGLSGSIKLQSGYPLHLLVLHTHTPAHTHATSFTFTTAQERYHQSSEGDETGLHEEMI